MFKSKKKLSLFALLFFSIFLTNCATSSKTVYQDASKNQAEVSSSDKSTDYAQEKAELIFLSQQDIGVGKEVNRENSEVKFYEEIVNLFQKKQFSLINSKTKSYEELFPESPFLAQVYNISGIVFLNNKLLLQAKHTFEKALSIPPKSIPLKQNLLYNLASTQFAMHLNADALNTLNTVQPSELTSVNRIKYYYLLSQVYMSNNNPVESVRYLLIGSLEDSSYISLIEDKLSESLFQVQNYDLLHSLFQAYETHRFASALLLRLAQLAEKNTKNNLAEMHLRTLLSRFPDSKEAPIAKSMLSTVEKLADTSGNKIGVLLPLNGRFSRFGQTCREAIEFGFTDSSKLVFEDSGETTESTLHALEQLVYEKKVIAVIGPLLSRGINEVTTRAQELGVPLINLSQQEGKSGDYVFQASITQKQQINTITEFAMGKLGFKNFAVLYPNTPFGKRFLNLFWDKILEKGGTITGVESYPPDTTDFRDPIKKLTGLYYLDARTDELKALAQKRNEDHITKRTRKTENYYSLPPIVDFDAVFIPEEANIVGQILPTFSYKDVENVTYLGVAAWNSMNVYKRAPKQSELSYFVDGFFSSNTQDRVQKFILKFTELYDRPPGQLDAIAYDVGLITSQILTQAGESGLSRKEFRDSLKATIDFPGITGKITYNAGELERSLSVLSFKNGSIVKINN